MKGLLVCLAPLVQAYLGHHLRRFDWLVSVVTLHTLTNSSNLKKGDFKPHCSLKHPS